eukprot:CAMPEP_0206548376 /NCGR_PEP_ID=MMETSP0325_2-20121206/13846_1 /ASSEMBLY_ACC=CAM_ASM_000347 /TAXON_ID=2866 /ORGANISM="Crypthecodinium cohnii, Strain Seligo" /LENGTH=258 /DNA_ID=CAMNT_0054047843 /DNA_START=59 /DNA_END=835 /DNA_ORIENTATION=+
MSLRLFASSAAFVAAATTVIPASRGAELPEELESRTGCDAICKSSDGEASCGFRMQYAATVHYRGQAQACDQAYVWVLLACPDRCEGCRVESSGCNEAVEAGIASNVGSPYWVAQEVMRIEDAEKKQHESPSHNKTAHHHPTVAPAVPAPMPARVGGSAEPPSLSVKFAKLAGGLSVITVLAALATQLVAKVKRWGLPATRAAASAGMGWNGGASPTGTTDSRGANDSFRYEGLGSPMKSSSPSTSDRSPNQSRAWFG